MTYCTATALKARLGISAATDDTMLKDIIDAAQSAIDGACNRTFEAPADTTRYFDPTRYVEGSPGWYQCLRLDTDLCQITTIMNGDGTTVTSSQYVTEPRNFTPWYEIRLKLNSSIAWTYNDTPEDAISITGRWAYSLTAPAAIEQACIRLAMWFYRQKDTSRDNSSDRPIMSASGAVLMPSQMPADVMALLGPYVRRMI